MSFSRVTRRGIVHLMPASTRAITALFVLLVAAGHQSSERAVIQVHGLWLTREAAVERSALPTLVRQRTVEPSCQLQSRPTVANPGCSRHRVMAGDLPAPREPPTAPRSGAGRFTR